MVKSVSILNADHLNFVVNCHKLDLQRLSHVSHPRNSSQISLCDSKIQLVEAFFQVKTDPVWLKMTSVSCVLYGPYERNLVAGHTFQDENMQIAFHSPDVLIYRVDK